MSNHALRQEKKINKSKDSGDQQESETILYRTKSQRTTKLTQTLETKQNEHKYIQKD